MRRWAPALAAAIAATMFVGADLTSAAPDSSASRRPEVKAALADRARCGRFVDSLPPLVIADDVRPGTPTQTVVVCVANRGNSNGALSLGASGVVETDPTCTGEEAAVDATCGGGGAGEAGAALTQHIAVDPECKLNQPPAAGNREARYLDSLDDMPVNLSTTLRPDQVVCVSLWLVNEAGAAATAAGQSDVIRWRYEFTLE